MTKGVEHQLTRPGSFWDPPFIPYLQRGTAQCVLRTQKFFFFLIFEFDLARHLLSCNSEE